MQNTHGSTRLIGRAALVALLAAPALGAQGRWENGDQGQSRERQRDEERRLFTWRGTVDGDTRIYVRGGDVQSQTLSGNRSRNRGRVDTDNALPRRDGVVRVELVEGRGRVYVVQQPDARNDYTAILRVSDAQRGASRYRFVAYFDPTNDWRNTDRSGRGNGRGNDNGGVWGNSGGDVSIGDRMLQWSGNVDGDLRISLWRGQVGYNVVSGQQPQNVRSSVGGQATQRTGQLTVSIRQGRGTVAVIEQPSSYNNYTAVVRVLDNPGGYGYYDFDLIWR